MFSSTKQLKIQIFADETPQEQIIAYNKKGLNQTRSSSIGALTNPTELLSATLSTQIKDSVIKEDSPQNTARQSSEPQTPLTPVNKKSNKKLKHAVSGATYLSFHKNDSKFANHIYALYSEAKITDDQYKSTEPTKTLHKKLERLLSLCPR